MIHFVKILAYPFLPEGQDPHPYLEQLTTQIVDPPSLHLGEYLPLTPTVFCSPLRRAREMLAVRPDQKLRILPELREVPFSFVSLCTPEEWSTQANVIVRRRFKEAFIQDRLLVTRRVLEQEIRTVLALAAEEDPCTCISHSFRLKLIEAFLKAEGELFRVPERIHEVFPDDQETYAWGTGFTVTQTEMQRSLGP